MSAHLGLFHAENKTIACIFVYDHISVEYCAYLSWYWDTHVFDIVADVLQGDTLDPYVFIICLDDVFKTSIYLMKENAFTIKKSKKQTIPCETITDADHAYDIVLLGNTPTQAESLMHSLEKAAGDIGLNAIGDKTAYRF